ncbi:MAG: hypothetical protein K2G88_03400 [Oscillospiraceae bacterium]|nr:hypothetical protein [Oscillospiraceae bacterium]
MNFNVPMRTTGILNSQTLAQQQGNIKSSIRLQHATNQDFMPNLSQSSQQNYYANPTAKPPVRQTLPQQNYHANSAPQPPMRQTLPKKN